MTKVMSAGDKVRVVSVFKGQPPVRGTTILYNPPINFQSTIRKKVNVGFLLQDWIIGYLTRDGRREEEIPFYFSELAKIN